MRRSQSTEIPLKRSARPWVRYVLGAGLPLAFAAICYLIVPIPKPGPKAMPKLPTPAETAAAERIKVDSGFNGPTAKAAYESFIDKYKSSPNKQIQDQVGAARIRLAYVTARQSPTPTHALRSGNNPSPQSQSTVTDRDRIEAARQIFLQAANGYKGTGTMASDFGGVKDQALYQAAACLNAEGKKAEYRAALVDFIKKEPLSPLVDAAHKRLVKLDGKDSLDIDAMLQADHDQQEKKIRFETSVCGPKCIVKLLEILAKARGKDGSKDATSSATTHSLRSANNPSSQRQTTLVDGADYRAIAKLCGTTDKGTTMKGLRKGLKAFGLDYYGYQVRRVDLPTVQTPAILYSQDHYLVVEQVKGLVLTVYDPMWDRERQLDFSKVPEDQAIAIMLLASPPKGAR